MVTIKVNTLKIIIVVLHLLILCGCEGRQISDQSISSNSTIQATIFSQPTYTILNTSIEEPTTQPHYTGTSTSIPTPSKVASNEIGFTRVPETPAPILTPAPTLSLLKSKELFHYFLNTNGNCDLPCLWGVVPGDTDVETFKRFVSQFGKIEADNFISQGDWSEQEASLFFEEKVGTYGYDVTMSGKYSQRINFLFLRIDGPKISHQTSLINNIIVNYQLSTILSKFGKPSQAQIAPWPDEPSRPNEWLPFNLLLFYPERGFSIEYIYSKEESKNFFIGCPNQLVGLSIITWTPKSSLMLSEIAAISVYFYGMNKEIIDQYYKPITDAIGLSETELVEQYGNNNSQTCFKAQRSKWPYGYLSTETASP